MLVILSSLASCNVEMLDGTFGSYVNSHGVVESASFLQNAALCLLGYAPSEDPRDQLCVADGTALLWFGLYITCCTAFNVLGCWLMKSMSATWCTVGSVLCLYLTAVFASSELLMGPEARPI